MAFTGIFDMKQFGGRDLLHVYRKQKSELGKASNTLGDALFLSKISSLRTLAGLRVMMCTQVLVLGEMFQCTS